MPPTSTTLAVMFLTVMQSPLEKLRRNFRHPMVNVPELLEMLARAASQANAQRVS